MCVLTALASHLVGFPHLDLAANAHDRAGERRVDEAWLEERWADPETRVLVVAGTRVRPVDGRIPWLAPAEASYAGRRVLLGERDGRTWFALLVDPDDARGDRGDWVGLRAVLPRLAGADTSATSPRRRWSSTRIGMAEWHFATRLLPALRRPPRVAAGRRRAGVRRLRQGPVPAHRPGGDHGDHARRPGLRRRGAAARPSVVVARGPVLDPRGLPRARRDPRGRRPPRGAGGGRRPGRRGRRTSATSPGRCRPP